MKKGENANRPEPGKTIKVEPITKLKDIRSIKKLLHDKPRDLCLFTLGINTNLRASDLLAIEVGQVRNVDELVLKERKTGKHRRITLNKAVRASVQGLLAGSDLEDSDHLFQSQRADRLTVPSVNRLVKQWCRMINLKGNYGMTFGLYFISL